MTFIGELRPYQTEHVGFMKARKKVLLAAQQGLGKTAMTIAAIEDQFDDGTIQEPGIWVTLSNLMHQTQRAIKQFAGETSVVEVVPAGSDSTFEQRLHYYDLARAQDTDYLILSYEAVKNDWSEVRTLPKGFMVVDEVSFIRGFRSERAQEVWAHRYAH
jgi:SNF2 family DNA or RNA helicase